MNAGTWRSADLPPRLRAQATRAVLSDVHLPWALSLDDRAAHDCSLDWHPLAGCSVIECRSERLSGWRDSRELRQTEGDHLGLLLVLAGRERVRQDDVALDLRPGDLLLWDGARPIRFEIVDPLHKVTLLIPRGRLERAVTGPEPRGAVLLDARAGLGALAAGHLQALARIGGNMPAGHAALAADVVIDLVARLLDPAEAAEAPDGLLARILGYVHTHFEDPQLTPSRIAATFGITPRYLHMLFAATGTTLSAHIRTLRLEAIRRDLSDTRLASRSITEIVLRRGFNDGAHATRAFSAAYGSPPSAYRAAQRR